MFASHKAKVNITDAINHYYNYSEYGYGYIPFFNIDNSDNTQVPKILVMTSDIFRSIKLKNLAYSIVRDYTKMREHFAINDLIELYSSYAILQRIDLIRQGYPLTGTSVADVRTENLISFSDRNLTVDPSVLNEWETTINPQLCNDQVINNLVQMLTDSTLRDIDIVYGDTFKIIDTNDRNIVVIMNKGFFNTLSSIEGRLFFYRKLIQSLCKFLSLADVSAHPAHLEYARELQSFRNK